MLTILAFVWLILVTVVGSWVVGGWIADQIINRWLK